LASFVLVLAVLTVNRNAMMKGRPGWTGSFLEVLASPGAVIFSFCVAALLTWAFGRLRIRR
jgi:hypothetical protein